MAAMTTPQALTANEQRVLGYLLNTCHDPDDGYLFTGPQEIQRALSLGYISVKAAVDSLVARGLVEKVGGQYRATGAA